MPCFRHTSLADSPAACSFKTLMICSSVNLLLRMSVSRRNGLYPKPGAFKGSRSQRLSLDSYHQLFSRCVIHPIFRNPCRIRQHRRGDDLMNANLIVIDSDAELKRARALVDKLMTSDDAADIARLEAQARLIEAYEQK